VCPFLSWTYPQCIPPTVAGVGTLYRGLVVMMVLLLLLLLSEEEEEEVQASVICLYCLLLLLLEGIIHYIVKVSGLRWGYVQLKKEEEEEEESIRHSSSSSGPLYMKFLHMMSVTLWNPSLLF